MSETTTAGLSKNDVKTLRTADIISFHHTREGGRINASKRVRNSPWHEETTIGISCDSSVFEHWEKTRWEGAYSCFSMIHCPKYSEEWQTIVSFLREGDSLQLRWIGCDNNGYLTRSMVTDRDEQSSPGLGEKLYHDKLYLKIVRGKKSFSFYLDDSICPDNSARMVKKA